MRQKEKRAGYIVVAGMGGMHIGRDGFLWHARAITLFASRADANKAVRASKRNSPRFWDAHTPWIRRVVHPRDS
jgi:hypothetical protein